MTPAVASLLRCSRALVAAGLFLLLPGAVACSPSASSGGSGGMTGSGGASSGSGGAGGSGGSASGGSSGSGGVKGTGGTSASGGSSASGGVTASGGATGTGGATSSGGASSGGAPGSGGVSSSGGATATGGAAGGAGGAPPSAVNIPRGGRCTAPATATTADTTAAWMKWKKDIVTSDGAGTNGLRLLRPNSSGAVVNSSVSEGSAYGMLIAVYMNDQDSFDKFWNYTQQFLDANGLMNWYIGPDRSVLGTGGATDADEDMAFALLMADKKWGGKGSLSKSYLDLATAQINLIWKYEIDHSMGDVPTPGDQGGGGGSVINISYFAPAFYRAFGRATNQTTNWNNTVATVYKVINATLNAANKNQSNGLVPAWSTPAGVPMGRPGTSDPTYHQLDSCRTPFRLAQDYCWNNEPMAADYLKKISAFYQTKGAYNLVDGYNLDGSEHPGSASVGNQAAAFVGPAAVGAMSSPDFAMLRDQGYADVATDMLFAGSQYYQESWTVLSLIMMTGMMDDLTLP